MTKILGIIGSPRKNGNTHILVDRILEGAEGAGASTEAVFLADLDIAPCDACEVCFKEKPCKFDDDMIELYDKFLEADTVIFGTPVYWWSPTAYMKTFIDRCRRYTHGPMEDAMKFKPGAVLTTAWFKHDGQELTTIPIHTFMNYVQMIMMGAKAYEHRRTPFVGALAHSTIEGRGSVDKTVRENVQLDELGMDLCDDVGRRIATIAKIIKAGKRQLGLEYPFPDESLVIPRKRKRQSTGQSKTEKPMV